MCATVGVAVAVGVLVGVDVGVVVAVGEGVTVSVAVLVGIAVGVAVGSGVPQAVTDQDTSNVITIIAVWFLIVKTSGPKPIVNTIDYPSSIHFSLIGGAGFKSPQFLRYGVPRRRGKIGMVEHCDGMVRGRYNPSMLASPPITALLS